MEDEALTEKVIGAAFAVHNALGSGFLESVYEKALSRELRDRGIQVETQFPIDVEYKNEVVGHFVADMIVEGRIVVELKAVEILGKSHEIQLVNYLKATKRDVGLVLNFGSPRLGVKRKLRTLSPVDPVHPVILSHISGDKE